MLLTRKLLQFNRGFSTLREIVFAGRLVQTTHLNTKSDKRENTIRSDGKVCLLV